MIKSKALEFLSGRHAKPGESLEFGWFVFRVTQGEDGLDLETLDFKSIASFTLNFDEVEAISREQVKVLESAGQQPSWCNLRQFATVSKSYAPESKDVFLERQSVSEGNDSGWYLGIPDDNLDLNDPSNLKRVSLYELSISDRRFLPYWLLPEKWTVTFQSKAVTVVKPN